MTTTSRHLVGAGLVERAGAAGGLTGRVFSSPDVDLAAAAAATPFLRRVALVMDMVGGTQINWREARSLAMSVAPSHHIAYGGGGQLVDHVLLTAVFQGLLTMDRSPAHGTVVRPGPRADLVTGHPLAAWGESLLEALVSEPIAAFASPVRWFDTALGVVLPLLLQRVACTGDAVDLDDEMVCLQQELEAKAARRRRAPRSDDLRVRIALLAAILEEFHTVTIRRDGPDDLGMASATDLGRFGFLLLHVETAEDLGPAVERFLRDHGRLPTRDGLWIDQRDLPVPISDN